MGRPQKKSKNKRKGNRNNGHHSRQEAEQEEPDVCFDPDPPVADDESGSASESDDASLIFDTVRVPEVALNCAIQAIQLGAVGMIPPHMAPPPPPPRRPAPAPNDDESHLSLMRYLGRRPVRRSRIRKGVPLNHIEPLVSYNRKMARVAPRSTLRTPLAQVRRESAALLCPCNQVEESQLRSIRAVQIFMRSPRFFRLMQFTKALASRVNALILQRRNQDVGARNDVQQARNEEPQLSDGVQQSPVSSAQAMNGSTRDRHVVNEDQKVENRAQLNGTSSVRQTNGTTEGSSEGATNSIQSNGAPHATSEESSENNAPNTQQSNRASNGTHDESSEDNGAQKTKEITKNGSIFNDDSSRNHKKESK